MCRAQTHGNRTKYVLMLDADMSVPSAWRLRAAVHRLALHCLGRPEDGLCRMAIDMPADLEGTRFHTLRLFPTQDVGTEKGWHYTYPVHEVCDTPCTSAQSQLPLKHSLVCL